MIELKISGVCENCDYIELQLDEATISFRNWYRLRCIHAEVCGQLAEELRQDPDAKDINVLSKAEEDE